MSDPTEFRGRLRAQLVANLKDRNRDAVTALRSALSAIENAEAVQVPFEPASSDAKVPAARLGVGVGDVQRRELSIQDLRAIVHREIADRLAAAAEYEARGKGLEAIRLRAEAGVLDRILTTS